MQFYIPLPDFKMLQLWKCCLSQHYFITLAAVNIKCVFVHKLDYTFHVRNFNLGEISFNLCYLTSQRQMCANIC
jgi:hypothetical protein